MKRLTYVAENGEVLFHPADLPDDEGITITQLAKDGRYKALEEIAERLANREQAEEQGLLLRLPCKVGDIVYKVNKASKKISKHMVLKIEIEKMEGTDFTTQIWFENYDFTFAHRFGEVIFFTRDEAEAKLKKMEGESDVL